MFGSAFGYCYGTNSNEFHVCLRRARECDELPEKHDEHHADRFIMLQKILMFHTGRRSTDEALDKQNVRSPLCD